MLPITEADATPYKLENNTVSILVNDQYGYRVRQQCLYSKLVKRRRDSSDIGKLRYLCITVCPPPDRIQ